MNNSNGFRRIGKWGTLAGAVVATGLALNQWEAWGFWMPASAAELKEVQELSIDAMILALLLLFQWLPYYS